jgi:CubicO group peptidase (beta-lactamase class C family)
MFTQRFFQVTWQRPAGLLCLLLSASFVQAQVKDQPRQLQWLGEAMAQSVDDFNLPSLSVAIVHDGQLIWSQSYGETVAGSGDKTTPATLYAVASNTKAFTSAAIAQLVDDGFLDWNDRVQTYLPWFELYDPYVSSELRIRDLLCHRSGLATFSGDLLWYGTKWSSKEVLEKANQLEPTTSFRTQFGYQNLMFMVAGEIIEVVSEKPWKTYIEQELMGPVGMSSSVLSTTQLANRTDVAAPHNELESGTQTPIEWVNWDNMAPAGALISSAEEMAQWMIVQLDSGRTATDTLWTQRQTHEMWTMHTPIPVSSWYHEMLPSMHFRGYGLGWELYDLHGRKVVAHSGGYDGMISRQVLVPEEKLGIIILTNANSSVPWGWGHDVLNVLLKGDKQTPMIDFLLEQKREEPAEQTRKEAELMASRIPEAPASKTLAAYAGSYSDAMYGDVLVSMQDDTLQFEFEPTPLFQGTLEHWHFDTFRLHWGTQMMLPKGMAQFTLNMKGQVESLDFDVPNPDFDFTELHFIKQSAER